MQCPMSFLKESLDLVFPYSVQTCVIAERLITTKKMFFTEATFLSNAQIPLKISLMFLITLPQQKKEDFCLLLLV